MSKKPKRPTPRLKSNKKQLQTQSRRRRADLLEIESKLTAHILKATLALHLLKNSKKPTSRLVDELFDIEIEVGHFISAALQGRLENLPSNLKGTLATTLSFMPLGPSGSEKSIKK